MTMENKEFMKLFETKWLGEKVYVYDEVGQVPTAKYRASTRKQMKSVEKQTAQSSVESSKWRRPRLTISHHIQLLELLGAWMEFHRKQNNATSLQVAKVFARIMFFEEKPDRTKKIHGSYQKYRREVSLEGPIINSEFLYVLSCSIVYSSFFALILFYFQFLFIF